MLARYEQLAPCGRFLAESIAPWLPRRPNCIGDGAVAVTGTSDALAAGELDAARDLATRIGIRHIVIPTDEFANPDYVREQSRSVLPLQDGALFAAWADRERLGVDVVVNGANADDLGDYRPGMQAATSMMSAVRSPNVDLTKQEVRQLAAAWELPVADKPATPCLSSRVRTASSDAGAARRIDRAEQFLRSLGFRGIARAVSRRRHGTHRSAGDEIGNFANQEFIAPLSRNSSGLVQVRYARPGRLPFRRSRSSCRARC